MMGVLLLVVGLLVVVGAGSWLYGMIGRVARTGIFLVAALIFLHVAITCFPFPDSLLDSIPTAVLAVASVLIVIILGIARARYLRHARALKTLFPDRPTSKKLRVDR